MLAAAAVIHESEFKTLNTRHYPIIIFTISYGEGSTIYFETNFGAVARDNRCARDLLRAMLDGRVAPAVSGNKLRPRFIGLGDQALLVIINDQAFSVSEKMTLPGKFQVAKDIYSEKQTRIVDNKLSVIVMPQNVAVFYIR